MEQVVIRGTSASGMIAALPGLGVEIRSIEIDIPMDEIGVNDPIVTLSGSYTGSSSYHGDTTLDLRYAYGEDIYITSSAFTSEYSAIIRYLRYGDQRNYVNYNRADNKYQIGWRLR